MRRDKKIKNEEIPGNRNAFCRRIIEYGILGLIVFSPLPAASVNEWSILVIQITVLFMMMAYFLMRKKPQPNEFLSPALRWPKFLFVGLFILIFIQIIPFPNFLVKIFSPGAYSFQKLYSPGFSEIKFMSFSLIPNHTLGEGLELLSYFLLGFLIVRTVTERRQIMRIFSVLIAMGIFEAFYGMFELYNKNPRILFYKKIHYLDTVTGTFVNRNHFSGYLEMIIPLTIGLILARGKIFSLAGMRWRDKVLMLSERKFSGYLLIAVAIVVMAVGIIFSRSRSGIFLLIFSFILFFGWSLIYSRKKEDQKKWASHFLKVIFIIILAVSLYVGIDSTLERFSPDRLLNEQRPVFWKNTLSFFADFPLVGTGLGTFASLYPDWDEGGNLVRIYHAHNDYLEYLSELGIIGFILLVGGVLYMLVKSFLVWRERGHPEVKGLALGGIVAVICILIHSITDFNLHIPANMLLFSVVLSLTVVIVFYKKRSNG